MTKFFFLIFLFDQRALLRMQPSFSFYCQPFPSLSVHFLLCFCFHYSTESGKYSIFLYFLKKVRKEESISHNVRMTTTKIVMTLENKTKKIL